MAIRQGTRRLLRLACQWLWLVSASFSALVGQVPLEVTLEFPPLDQIPLPFPSETPAQLPPVSDLPAPAKPEQASSADQSPNVAGENQTDLWWETAVVQSLGMAPESISVEVNSLIYDTLRHSAQVQAVGEYAGIAETGILEAKAGFDPRTFLETRFQRLNIPTGSQLDAGFNVSRLQQNDWLYKGGMRQKNLWGGNWEFSQQVGGRNSNSQFFSPNRQGSSRLSLNFTQPLLNGAGRAYNTSMIVLATIDLRIAADRTALELQDYLLRVTEAHWELYRVRCALLQKRKNLTLAESLFEHLQHRQELDVNQSQILQARAAIALRRAAIIQLETAVRNAESRVRALVNSPTLLDQRTAELVTVEAPQGQPITIDFEDALVTALKQRPEVDRALGEIDAASVKLCVARNELLPVLDAVVDTYVSGLRGNYAVTDAWNDQFTRGGPTYTAGLLFEVPLYRRAARARIERREIELRQLASQFRSLTETIRAEVEIATRDVETAQRLQSAKRESLLAAVSNLQFFHRRWELLPGDDRSASLLLQDLLEAQDRVNTEEESLVQTQVAAVMSLARLNRTTGMLLQIYTPQTQCGQN